MATNINELGEIYKKIFVVSMIEKLKNCSVVWNKTTPVNFSSELIIDNIVWNISLFRTPNQSSSTLSFFRNSKLFYSISSDLNPDVESLYNEVDQFESVQNESILLKDIQNLNGCNS